MAYSVQLQRITKKLKDYVNKMVNKKSEFKSLLHIRSESLSSLNVIVVTSEN